MTHVNRQTDSVRTLRWNGNTIEMIDQRLLPHRIEYVACDSARSVADAIRNMVVRGAPAIGVAAAYGVALEAVRLQNADRETFASTMQEGFSALSASRPTAVNLFWAPCGVPTATSRRSSCPNFCSGRRTPCWKKISGSTEIWGAMAQLFYRMGHVS